MLTWTMWILGGIAAWFGVVPLLVGLAVEIKDRVWPRKGLPPEDERRWVGAGALMMRIAEQVNEGKISQSVAEARVSRIARYAEHRLSGPEPHERWALDAMRFAQSLVRAKRHKHRFIDMPSPSPWVH